MPDKQRHVARPDARNTRRLPHSAGLEAPQLFPDVVAETVEALPVALVGDGASVCGEARLTEPVASAWVKRFAMR